jgi:hypothetical protein
MRVSKRSLVVIVVAACCLLVIWLSTSIHGGQRTYEVRPEISIPEYKTDAGRAIDAYERLMDRYMDLTERNLFRINTDIQEVMKKLELLDEKLTQLSVRISRIENALGIKQPRQSIVEKTPIKASEQKATKEASSQDQP